MKTAEQYWNPILETLPIDLVKTKLVDQLRLKTNLGYNIEFHQYNTLSKYDLNSKRFKDLRHKE